MVLYELDASLAKKIDLEVIPAIVLQPVLNRNYFALINILKRNQLLCRQLISFYYQTLKVTQNFIGQSKTGCAFTIPWKTKYEEENNKPLILSFEYQYQLWQWVTINNTQNAKTQSDFQFLIFSLGNYLTQLRTAQRTLNQKQDACCYYYLGINIKNNEQLRNYLRKWIY
jgi:hypothetical protein